MEIVNLHCAGLDVHKQTVVACVRIVTMGQITKETRSFGTMTDDLLALADWLLSHSITHVAMESTGEYWKPLFAILEGQLTVWVVNAQHIKQVPGRKTDVKDAEWIAELLAHGLLRPSFIPPQPQRDLRDLTRQRTNLIRERAAVANRLQKVLEWASLKLASVATDVLGKSGRAMLDAIVDGQSDVAELAALAQGRMRAKRAALEQALSGRVRDHHRFLIAAHLEHVDFLDEQIAAFDAQITALIELPEEDSMVSAADDGAAALEASSSPLAAPTETSVAPLTWVEAVAIWDDLPGVGRRVAKQLVAEVGTDLRQLQSARHLASWAKLCPGNHESAGKRTSVSIGRGNSWLRSTLIQAAHAAVRVKESYLAAFYHRLVVRRGKKKAIVAVAHKLLVLAYTLIRKRQRYHDPGAGYYDARQRNQLAHRLQARIERLGYNVTLEPQSSVAA